MRVVGWASLPELELLEQLLRAAVRHGGPKAPLAKSMLPELAAELASVRAREKIGTLRFRDGTSEPLVGHGSGTVQVMSVKQAARRLGCGERNVVKLAERGTVVAVKVGGRWQLEADSVEAHAFRRGVA